MTGVLEISTAIATPEHGSSIDVEDSAQPSEEP